MALISLTKLVDVNLLRYSDFLDPTPGVWMEPQTSHKPTHFNTSPSPTCDKVKDASVCSRPTWRTVCLFNQPAPTSSWFFLGGSTDQFFTWSTWLCCLFACCHLKLPWTWAAFYLASTTVLETPGPKCWLFQSHPIFSWAPPPKQWSITVRYGSPPVHLIQFLSWRKIFTSWGQNGDVTSTEIASTRHLPCQRQPRSHKKKRYTYLFYSVPYNMPAIHSEISTVKLLSLELWHRCADVKKPGAFSLTVLLYDSAPAAVKHQSNFSAEITEQEKLDIKMGLWDFYLLPPPHKYIYI